MINWTDDQLEEAGLDPLRVERLVKKLRQCSKEMTAMGLNIYGSDGSGYLIHRSRPEHDPQTGEIDEGAIIAHLGFGFDGGGW